MEGDQQRKKLPFSLLWFSFFQIQKSPIIYLSLSLFCVYKYCIYTVLHSIYIYKKREKKYRIPHVWSLIGSAQYRNVVAQGRRKKTKQEDMFVCFSSSSSSCGEPMALCFFFFSLWCCCLVCGCVYTGVVNGYHHLGFYLAFHSRSVWPSSDRSDGRNPQHIVAQHMKRRSSSSNSSYICIYLYFKKRTQQHVINIALSQCHLPHIKKMLLFVFLLLLLAAVKSYKS